MDDLISRQAAIDELKKYIAVNKNPNHDARIWEEGMNCAVSVIGSLPSVQPERKKGKWIYEERKRLIDETDDGPVYRVEKWWKCSECGYEKGFLPFNPDDNFCPNCGCKMRQEGEDHD